MPKRRKMFSLALDKPVHDIKEAERKLEVIFIFGVPALEMKFN